MRFLTDLILSKLIAGMVNFVFVLCYVVYSFFYPRPPVLNANKVYLI